jgi:sialidase-1
MAKKLDAEHGIVCRLPGERFGYFGWPTVARMDDGTLAVVSSGLRTQHVCPWGKGVLNLSTDDGRTWSPPRVIHDTPLDDRDGGIVSLGGRRLLAAWFTSDTRHYEDWCREHCGEEDLARWRSVTHAWTDETMRQWLGSWVALSEDGGETWSDPIRVPLNTSHGPIRLRDGALLYLGKRFSAGLSDMEHGPIVAYGSADAGRTWIPLGEIPVMPGTWSGAYHEPHVVELPSGRLIGMIRVQDWAPQGWMGPPPFERLGLVIFSMMQTESTDGGHTWSVPKPLGFHGSPPHLLRHSSGVLILTYGYRLPPFGQRVAVSRDDGATWEHDWTIRDDGPDLDLGYPSTVEMADSSLFTVYYQKVKGGEKCSLLWSRWRLPTPK